MCPLHIAASSTLPHLVVASFSLLLILSSRPLLPLPPLHRLFSSLHRRCGRRCQPSATAMSSLPTLHFSSPESLSDWLSLRLPADAFSAWGSAPGTKTVHNLWLELAQGETSLADSFPPLRTVHVAAVRILSPSAGRLLLESHQLLSDGSIRPRLRPLSEKMKPDETVEAAVFRAVREELGSVLPRADESTVRIVPGSYRCRVEERASASYPGLPACYILHTVEAWVDGLPDEEFSTEEEEFGSHGEAADKAVFVKCHFWKWVDAESFDPF